MLRPFITSNRSLVEEGAVVTAVLTKKVIKLRSRNSHRVSIGTGRSIARGTCFTRLPLLCLCILTLWLLYRNELEYQ